MDKEGALLISSSLVNCLIHGYDVFGWDIGFDVMDLAEDESSPLLEYCDEFFYVLLDFFWGGVW